MVARFQFSRFSAVRGTQTTSFAEFGTSSTQAIQAFLEASRVELAPKGVAVTTLTPAGARWNDRISADEPEHLADLTPDAPTPARRVEPAPNDERRTRRSFRTRCRQAALFGMLVQMNRQILLRPTHRSGRILWSDADRCGPQRTACSALSSFAPIAIPAKMDRRRADASCSRLS